MLWLLVDAVVALLAVLLMAFVAVGLYRHVRTLIRVARACSSTLAEAGSGLDVSSRR